MSETYLTKRTVDVFDGTVLKEGSFISFCKIDPNRQTLGKAIVFGGPLHGMIHKVKDHEMEILHHNGIVTHITTSQLQGIGAINNGMKYKILGVKGQAF